MKRWNERQSVAELTTPPPERRLARSLTFPMILAFGLASSVVSTMIFSAQVWTIDIGPMVFLALAAAGMVVCCGALVFSEMATRVPSSGSAYAFCSVGLGDLTAWIAGSCLILAYLSSASYFGVALSSMLQDLLSSVAVEVPAPISSSLNLEESPSGLFDLPAAFFVVLTGSVLAISVRGGGTLTLIGVTAKLLLIGVFSWIGLSYLGAQTDFSYFDASQREPSSLVLAIAASIGFLTAFDLIATTTEEAKHPRADIRRAMMSSVLIPLVFVSVAAAAWYFAIGGEATLGTVADLQLAQSAVLQNRIATVLWLIGHLAALLAYIFGLSRFFHAVSRARMIPSWFAVVSSDGSPVRVTIFTTIVVALCAGLLPAQTLTEFAYATPFAIAVVVILVSVSLLVIMWREGKEGWSLSAPLIWILAGVAIIGYGSTFLVRAFGTEPNQSSQMFLLGWIAAGIVTYIANRIGRSFLDPVEDVPKDAAKDLLGDL